MRDVSLLSYDSPKEPERAIFAVPFTCFDCCDLITVTLLVAIAICQVHLKFFFE